MCTLSGHTLLTNFVGFAGSGSRVYGLLYMFGEGEKVNGIFLVMLFIFIYWFMLLLSFCHSNKRIYVIILGGGYMHLCYFMRRRIHAL